MSSPSATRSSRANSRNLLHLLRLALLKAPAPAPGGERGRSPAADHERQKHEPAAPDPSAALVLAGLSVPLTATPLAHPLEEVGQNGLGATPLIRFDRLVGEVGHAKVACAARAQPLARHDGVGAGTVEPLEHEAGHTLGIPAGLGRRVLRKHRDVGRARANVGDAVAHPVGGRRVERLLGSRVHVDRVRGEPRHGPIDDRPGQRRAGAHAGERDRDCGERQQAPLGAEHDRRARPGGAQRVRFLREKRSSIIRSSALAPLSV